MDVSTFSPINTLQPQWPSHIKTNDFIRQDSKPLKGVPCDFGPVGRQENS